MVLMRASHNVKLETQKGLKVQLSYIIGHGKQKAEGEPIR